MARVTQHVNHSAIILPMDFGYLVPDFVVQCVLHIAFMLTVVGTVALMVALGVILFMMYEIIKDWFLTFLQIGRQRRLAIEAENAYQP